MVFSVFLPSADVGTSTVADEDRESLETLRFTVNIESLALVLYSSQPKQVSRTFQKPGSSGAQLVRRRNKVQERTQRGSGGEWTTTLLRTAVGEVGSNRTHERLLLAHASPLLDLQTPLFLSNQLTLTHPPPTTHRGCVPAGLSAPAPREPQAG